MILNEGYISLLTEQEDYSDFSSHTKIIYEYVTEHEITSIKPLRLHHQAALCDLLQRQ